MNSWKEDLWIKLMVWWKHFSLVNLKIAFNNVKWNKLFKTLKKVGEAFKDRKILKKFAWSWNERKWYGNSEVEAKILKRV